MTTTTVTGAGSVLQSRTFVFMLCPLSMFVCMDVLMVQVLWCT